MTSLKESVIRHGHWYPNDLAEWAEGYIKELEEHLKKQEQLIYAKEAISEMLRFLRGETKQ